MPRTRRTIYSKRMIISVLDSSGECLPANENCTETKITVLLSVCHEYIRQLAQVVTAIELTKHHNHLMVSIGLLPVFFITLLYHTFKFSLGGKTHNMTENVFSCLY